MAKLYDWVKQTVSGTPGTGPVTLATAVDTYITLANAGITDGELVYYTIVDGSNRERGIGTYSTTGPILTRTFIQGKLEAGTYTENPGTGLTLTSAAIVGCSPVAATHNFRGCELSLTANQSIPDITLTAINWNNEITDTDGFHESVTNPNRITIPAGKGIRKIELVFLGTFAVNGTGERAFSIRDSAGNYLSTINFASASSSSKSSVSILTGILEVSDSDWFECIVYQSSGAVLNFESSTRSKFKIRVIE